MFRCPAFSVVDCQASNAYFQLSVLSLGFMFVYTEMSLTLGAFVRNGEGTQLFADLRIFGSV